MDIKIIEDELNKINEKQKSVINKNKSQLYNKQNLEYYFKNINTKEKRKKAIILAYNALYSQVEISKYTKLSES